MAGTLGARLLAEPPIPLGENHTTVSYPTASGMASFSGDRAYGGLLQSDASNLGTGSNISSFSSANRYGRRISLATSNPAYAHVIGPDETLVAQTFFKINNAGDYFPGILADGNVTISVQNIPFNQTVTVQPTTFLFHTLWRDDQADLLPHPYHHLHNLFAQTATLRDAEDFLAGGIIDDFPEPNYALSAVSPVFTGNGTDTLGYTLTVPYSLFRNLAESGHAPPPAGLPAPHGFLEPFHFHVEYIVTPEPATLLLMAPALLLLRRKSRRS